MVAAAPVVAAGEEVAALAVDVVPPLAAWGDVAAFVLVDVPLLALVATEVDLLEPPHAASKLPIAGMLIPSSAARMTTCLLESCPTNPDAGDGASCRR